MKITEALLAEHAVFHTLFDHVERITPRVRTVGELRSLAGLIESVMAPHSKAEDTLLIEALDHAFAQVGHHDTFHDEHEQVEEHLRLAQQARTVKQARQNLMAAMTKARSHFDKEERIVFPLAEKLLKARTLEDLGRKWRDQRG